MAAITYTDGTVREYVSGESKVVIWLSPSTADADDTVVLPTVTGKTPRLVSAVDTGDGSFVTSGISTQTLTLDASGNGSNTTYCVAFTYI